MTLDMVKQVFAGSHEVHRAYKHGSLDEIILFI
jgi:hypothetical protein